MIHCATQKNDTLYNIKIYKWYNIFKMWITETSLVFQWLRICMSTKGTLILEDSLYLGATYPVLLLKKSHCDKNPKHYNEE